MNDKFISSHNFVIISPRRTGSILIANALEIVTGKHRIRNDIVNGIGIIHSHEPNPKSTVDRSKYILIISRRRDTFASAISEVIARHTHECENYTDKKILPFTVAVEEFKYILDVRRDFYRAINTTGYAKIFTVCFEDMLNYTNYLFERLDFENVTPMPVITKECPYHGIDIIENYSELEKYWIERTDS